MSLPSKMKTWSEPTDGDPIMVMEKSGPVIMSPLFAVEGDNGNEAVVCAMYEQFVGGDNWAQSMIVMLPGLCGHYHCGGTIKVSLN